MFELQHITAGYGDTTVLRDVSITVPDSTVVALLGPNGAGQDHHAARGVRPRRARRRASVTLDGDDITRLGPYQRVRRGLCHIPEGRGIFPSLTVRENLILDVARRARKREAFERAIDTFPVLGTRQTPDRGHAERRRAADARARARVRVEPEAWCSSTRRRSVSRRSSSTASSSSSRSLAAEGVALLIVEQYVSRALALASDRLPAEPGRDRVLGAVERTRRGHDLRAVRGEHAADTAS